MVTRSLDSADNVDGLVFITIFCLGRDTIKGNVGYCAARCSIFSGCQPTASGESGTAEDRRCVSICFSDCIRTPRTAFRDTIDNQIARD